MFISNYTGSDIDTAVGKVLDGKVGGMTSITYEELVELRKNSQLTPGMQYRITDYMTTTVQENTRSAEHQFDIIVTADSKNVLNEKSRAIQHDFSESEEEDYFANSDLNAWELWYSLDNDTERFAWADGSQTIQFKLTNDDQPKTGMIEGLSTEIVESVSNGIITTSNFLKIESDLDKLLYVKDDNVGSKIYTESGGNHLEIYINKCENTNEHEGFVNGSYTYIYKLTTGYGTNNKVEYFVRTKTKYKLITKTDWYDNKSAYPANEWHNLELNGSPTSYFVPTDFLNIIDKTGGISVLSYSSPSVCGEITNVTDNGKGVIYRMIDEWNNDCPYDFKNIQFARWEIKSYKKYVIAPSSVPSEVNDNSKRYVTLLEGHLHGLYKDPTISFVKPTALGGGYSGYYVDYTTSDTPTYCYTFGEDTDYSLNGNNNNVNNNVIKEYKLNGILKLNNIVFLFENSFSNTFGVDCHNNTFANYCNSNTFGNRCWLNVFEDNCYNNTFGNDCCYNCFDYACSNNTFGNNCQINRFENESKGNTFGNMCQVITFGEACIYNTFGNDNNLIDLGNFCTGNVFGNRCHDFSVGSESDYNTIGSGYTSTDISGGGNRKQYWD